VGRSSIVKYTNSARSPTPNASNTRDGGMASPDQRCSGCLPSSWQTVPLVDRSCRGRDSVVVIYLIGRDAA